MVKAQVEVYEGMIIGIHKRENDLNVNAVKGKALNNVRTAGADEKLILSTPRALTLESAFEFIDDNERVEITPSTSPRPAAFSRMRIDSASASFSLLRPLAWAVSWARIRPRTRARKWGR